MSRKLVDAVAAQTEVLLKNARICLNTCDMQARVYGMPLWKHAYHMLHSLDRWYINPKQYVEPPFHVRDLNSLDVPSGKALTKGDLENYLEGIAAKLRGYLAELTDDLLAEKPEGCGFTRLSLILGQFRHVYAHVGIINCSTIEATGKWPRVMGLNAVYAPEDELFE
jgi:hypothetical protein